MKFDWRIVIWVLTLAMLVCLLLWAPEWMADRYRFLTVKDWADNVSANRALLVNIIGGAAVGITIYFTYQNFLLTQDKQETETFAKAVEQLGSTNIAVRLGGIYTLDRIARKSKDDYFPALQVLTGYLRDVSSMGSAQTPAQLSPGNSTCPVDYQAILTIVGQRYWPDAPGYSLDLSYTNLRDAWLPSADMSNIYFWRVKFTGVNFTDADLSEADFFEAKLHYCNFTNAKLSGANFEGAEIFEPIGLTMEQFASMRKNPKS
jgi:hypothetical protein